MIEHFNSNIPMVQTWSEEFFSAEFMVGNTGVKGFKESLEVQEVCREF